MPTDPLLESNRVKVAKFVAVALAMIGVAVAAFVLAAYLTEALEMPVPLGNLFLSILLCTAGLVLSGMALRGRGTWKEVASLAEPMRPTYPPGWSKTINDLLAENRNISGEEIEWARNFEREQLRSWARFPRPGEVYELMGDAEISYLTHWGAPFTGGGKGMLRQGTQIRIAEGTGDAEPIGVSADPLDKARIESELVPEIERTADGYAGFSLSISTSELNRLFRRITATNEEGTPG